MKGNEPCFYDAHILLKQSEMKIPEISFSRIEADRAVTVILW